MTIAEQLEAHRGTMTLQELADLLAVSYKTVYKWVQKSSLPAQKIGGSYWIDPYLAAQWWKSHSTTITPPHRSAKVALKRNQPLEAEL